MDAAEAIAPPQQRAAQLTRQLPAEQPIAAPRKRTSCRRSASSAAAACAVLSASASLLPGWPSAAARPTAERMVSWASLQLQIVQSDTSSKPSETGWQAELSTAVQGDASKGGLAQLGHKARLLRCSSAAPLPPQFGVNLPQLPV